MDFSHLRANERKHDPRDYQLGAAPAPTQRPSVFLPDNSWLKRNFQGQTAFCGEHAGSHLKAILDYYASNGQTIVRKTPRYGAIKLKNPSSPVYDGYAIDAGTDMRSIFKWLQKVGAADYEPLENNVFLSSTDYVNPSVITPAMDANAAQSTIDNYAFGNTDFDSICNDIYQRKAVLLLIKCDDGFWGTSNPTFTSGKYGHFVVGDGYDEVNGKVRVIDSADPDEAHAVKMIDKKYIVPAFIRESGTAIDTQTAQAIKGAIVSDSATVVNILSQENDIPVPVKKNALRQLADFLMSLFSPKVGSASSTMNSKLFSLHLNDVEKALIMAVLVPVAGYVGQCLQAFSTGGSFSLNWTTVWHLALSGFVGYLIKNYLTNSQGTFLGSEPAA